MLDIMIWATMDNGEKLLKTTALWVQGTNKRKIELVLFMTNCYPLQPFDLLKDVLRNIKKIYPDLSPRCDYWLESVSDEK